MTTQSARRLEGIRVFCSMCLAVSDVAGAAIPRSCPSCGRRGFLTLARRTEYVPDRSPAPVDGWTNPLREWWCEYQRRDRLGLPQLEIRTERQREVVEGRSPTPIGSRSDE